jgi:Double zinc ribbon
MDCPVCTRPMTRGQVKLGYTLWGFVWAGWSILSLFFQAPGAKRRQVLDRYEERSGHLCETCGALFIPGSATWSCPSCGSEVPATRRTCGKCGEPPDTRRCPRCGTELPAGAATCPRCAS